MIRKIPELTLVLLLAVITFIDSYGQSSIAAGINYQAVARDNAGKELVNKAIDVKFSIIAENPVGEVVYQEVHSNKATSRYGVFSLVIGKGTYTSGIYRTLHDIKWGLTDHYLKVEIKFENDFLDMGTMQFMAVPYALYAWKSLEPGPEGPKGEPGPKGDPGAPASDNQNLSFDQSLLTISNGNSVPLTSLLQNLTISNTPEGNYLGISRGNSVLLSTIESDGDPVNEIQDLNYDAINRKLTLLKSSAPAIDLTELKNDADADPSNEIQSLTFNPVDNRLQISSRNTVDLTALKDDADANPANELQTISFDRNSGNLSISSRNTVSLTNTIGFKAKRSTSQTGLTAGTTYPFINSEAEFIEGSCYDSGTGIFTATSAGIYNFNITFKADGSGSARALNLLKNGSIYEVLGPDITAGTELTKSVTMKLNSGDVLSLTIYTGLSTFSGTGSFLGYKVN